MNRTRTARSPSARAYSDVAGFRLLHHKQLVYFPQKLYQNQSVTVGRTRQSDIRVRHPSVSRLHCTIDRTVDGRFMISNANTKNGLRVSERGRYSRFRPCAWHVLEIGHHVRLGDVTLVAVDANGECPITAQNSADVVACGMAIYGSRDKVHQLFGLPRRLIDLRRQMNR